MGVVLSLTGLMLIGSGCITGFEKRSQPVVFEPETPAVEAYAPIEPAQEAEASKPAPAVEEEAAPVPAKRPWYKRLWRKAPAAVNGEGTEEAPEQAKASKPGVDIELSAISPEADAMFSPSGEPLIKKFYPLRVSVSAGGRVEVPEQVKTVSEKGEISLPLIGSVVCEGLTLKEVSDTFSKLYGQFIRGPQVSVEFVYEGRPGEISPWGSVVVSGDVGHPGRVNIPPTRDLTLSQAIQLAGGAPKTADQSSIVVYRRLKEGTVKKIEVNLLAVAKQGQRDKDIVLEPGDSIYVPESIW